jgi:hypothetical protein
MAKKNGVRLGVLAVVLTFVMVFAGCATVSSVGGTVDTHGLISSAKAVSVDSEEIASYGVILGLLDSGYEDYVSKVKEAEAGGKKVTSVTKQYFGVYTKVTAYAQ